MRASPRRVQSTGYPRAGATSPQPLHSNSTCTPGLSTGTPCSGAATKPTTRSCVLGLTRPRSRRNVGRSLGTPRRIAREAAGQQVRTSAEVDHRPGSGGWIGSLSQLPDRGRIAQTDQSELAVRSRTRRGRSCSESDPQPRSRFPSPRPDASRQPTTGSPELSVQQPAARSGPGLNPGNASRPIDQTMSGLEERSNQWPVSPRSRFR